MKKSLVMLMLIAAQACFAGTATIYTDSYEGDPYSKMLSYNSPDVAFDIGGNETHGSFWLGNRTGPNGLLDGDVDGEYCYQAVISFRITNLDVPVGIPITDVKLWMDVRSITFQPGYGQMFIYALKAKREGTLFYPSWNNINNLLDTEWANVAGGLGNSWDKAHTSPIDIQGSKFTLRPQWGSSGEDQFLWFDIDIDSVFPGVIPPHGQGAPIDVSFLLMSGTEDSLIDVSNGFPWNDPIYLEITYGGNPVPTSTPTNTAPGPTPTFTPTIPTPTRTDTPTVTATPTNTGATPTPTPTNTGVTPTNTATPTKTWTRTPTITNSLSPTRTPTHTNTTGATQTPTDTHTLTPTYTTIPTATVTDSPTTGATSTPTPTWTITQTMTVTNTETALPTPTSGIERLLGAGAGGNPVKVTTGYIPNLLADDATIGSMTADNANIGAGYISVGGQVVMSEAGVSIGEQGRWASAGTVYVDNDTYLTQAGVLYLQKPVNQTLDADSWNPSTGIISTDSTSRTGELRLGYGTGGFNLYGDYTTTGKLRIGSDTYIELDATDSALELAKTNFSLRANSPEIHFGAEQGGTGFGEAYLKWNTTQNQFSIGDYTYPTPGAVDAVLIDTDDNSVHVYGDLTVDGTLYGVSPTSIVNASQVTAGTFGAGNYVFPGNLTFSGTDPQLIFPNSDAMRYTNATAVLDVYDGATSLFKIDVDDGLVGVGATNASYKFDVLNSGATGPDYAIFANNTKTEESSQWGIKGVATGSHGTGVNIGVEGTATTGTAGNRGGDFAVSGSVGTTNYAVRAVEYSTSVGTKYGVYTSSTGANGTTWDLYTAGAQSRINGMLQLTDTGQQITVDTSANTFKFGNSVTADQFTIDTDNGNIVFAGSMNPGSEFAVTGEVAYYDGTTLKGLAAVGASGEVLKSQGAGLPPVWGTASGAHDAVTLAGAYDYITLTGQVITRGQIDLATDVTGTLADGNIAATISRDSEVAGLFNLTANKALISSSTGIVKVSTVSNTELGSLSGVTSALQTQLDAKSTKTFTANRAMQSNSSTGLLEVSASVDTTELGHLDGVTGAIQGQLNGKQATITGSATTIDTETLTASKAVQTDASGKITTSSYISGTELNYLDGLTGDLVTLLAAKMDDNAAIAISINQTNTTPVVDVVNTGTDAGGSGNHFRYAGKFSTTKTGDSAGQYYGVTGYAQSSGACSAITGGDFSAYESVAGVNEVYGVKVTATGGTTAYGIYGSATAGTTNWAGYFGDGDVIIQNTLNHGAGSAKTIAGGQISATKTRHSVTAAGASDTLNNISNGTTGDILYLCGTAGKTITIADGAGNIECGANITLDSANDWVMFMFDGTNWQEVPGIDN